MVFCWLRHLHVREIGEKWREMVRNGKVDASTLQDAVPHVATEVHVIKAYAMKVSLLSATQSTYSLYPVTDAYVQCACVDLVRNAR